MGKLTKEDIKELLDKSYRSRVNILKMMRNGEGHIGGAYSSLDIMTVLYNKVLRHDPESQKWDDRDRFILSAGHKCLALYVTLADQGYFDEDILWTYNTIDTKVQMHPDEKALAGVEFPTGSLGHGLPVANGIALTAKLDSKNFPDRHFKFGIQEQSSMGTVTGMSLSGKIPFITAYVPFITFRCFEQIRDDVCKTNLNVKYYGK